MIANISSSSSIKRANGQAPVSAFQAFCLSSVRVMQHLLRNPMTLMGSSVVLLLLLVAAFAPWIATHDPIVQNLGNALQLSLIHI